MEHDRWLKEEVARWEEEGVVSAETGNAILGRYEKEKYKARGDLLFVVATVCILAGAVFLCAGFWNELEQDQRFWLALAPLFLSFLFLAAAAAADKKEYVVPAEEREGSLFNADGSPAYGEEALPTENGVIRSGKAGTVQLHRRVPATLRELAGFLHGAALLGAAWMVRESFTLGTDEYGWLALCTVCLLAMTYGADSASLGAFTVFAAVETFHVAPYTTWPQVLAWAAMMGLIPFLFFLLREGRQKDMIALSWMWASALLLLIFWSTDNLFWQTLFFSLAASMTWLAGDVFRKYGAVPQALRIFGGAAVVAVLLEASFGEVWKEASGNWILWFLFLAVLVPDLALLFRTAGRERWLSVLAGLTPFVLLMAAVISLFETGGALSAAVVSVYSAVLALGLVIRGYRTDEAVMKWCGIFMIVGVGLLRIFDSVWTLGQRGLFFLTVGVIAALICLLFQAPLHMKRKGRKRKGASSDGDPEEKGEEARHA